MKATVGRIWEAASKEKTRPALTHVWFDAEAATLTATNSYIAARVPCEVEEGDESGMIPAVALKTANGQSLRIADGKATLKVLDTRGAVVETRAWPLGTGEHPDVGKILAETESAPAAFGLNADMLQQLSLALGCGGKSNRPVALHPVTPLRGMLVGAGFANPEEAGVGVIMPVRLASFRGYEERKPEPDFDNPDVVAAAARAWQDALGKRRGKKRAAEAFHAAAIHATAEAAVAAQTARAAA